MYCRYRNIYVQDGKEFRKINLPFSNGIGCGIESFFFPLNSRRGLKVFADKVNARNSFKRQSKAALHGVGPKVLSKKIFKVIFPIGFDRMFPRKEADELFDFFENNDSAYGYYTQIVKTFDNESGYSFEEENELQRKLYKLFPKDCLDDLHYGNLGRIGKKLVCIDFGDESAS